MAKRPVSQQSFTSGEISPRLYGRSDVGRFKNALRTSTNAISLPQGPVRKRNGTKFLTEVKDSTKEVRLIKFQFSNDDSFVLEFGDTYVRFLTNAGIVVDTADFTNGTFDSDISSWTDISAGTGAIAHNAGNSSMDITGVGAGNEGRAEQALTLGGTGSYTITADATGDLTVKVGTTSGASDIATGTLSLGTGSTYTFTNTTVGTVYFTFENANSDTRELDNVVLSNTALEITTPYDETEVQDIQVAQFGSALYIAHPDYEPRVLTRISTISWTLTTLNAFPPPTVELGYSPSATLTPGATSGTGVTFTAGSSVFLEADVGRQINNLNGNGRAAIVGYTSGTQVTCDILDNFDSTSAIASGDWEMDFSPIAELTPTESALGTITNITCDAPGTATAYTTFRSDDVGKYIHLHGGIVKILTINSGSDIDGEVVKSLDAVTETSVWTLEEPDWSASRGYPRAVAFFEQRLWFGGSSERPQTLWGSEIGLYDSFGRGADDADGIAVDISSTEVNQIEWISASNELILGTTGAELTVDSSTAGAITPSTIRQKVRTYFGSNRQTPVVIANEILFKQRSKRKLRSFIYDFNIDGYRAPDITFLCEHLTEDLIGDITYAQEPDSTIFATTEAGDLLVGMYVKEEGGLAWSKYTTDGSYEHVLSISEGSRDEVYVVVNRTIDGSTARYIEIFDSGDGTDWLDGYSDSYLTYSVPKTVTAITAANPAVVTSANHGFSNGDIVKIINVVGMTELNNRTFTVANAATNTFELSGEDSSAYTAYVSGGEAHKMVTVISGLDHLEGKTVQIKADGAVSPSKTVASGSITLSSSAAEVTVGLPYTMTLETLNMDMGSPNVSGMGQRMRRVSPILQLYRSTLPTLNNDLVPNRNSLYNMDEAVPLYSGFVEYGPVDWSQDAKLTIVDSQPLPIQLLSILGTGETNFK